MKLKHKIRFFIYDVINGIRSGIPLCCVLDFCLNDWYWDKKTETDFYFTKMDKLHDPKSKYYAYNYVPCKKCFYKFKIINIKMNGVIGHCLLPKLPETRTRG